MANNSDSTFYCKLTVIVIFMMNKILTLNFKVVEHGNYYILIPATAM